MSAYIVFDWTERRNAVSSSSWQNFSSLRPILSSWESIHFGVFFLVMPDRNFDGFLLFLSAFYFHISRSHCIYCLKAQIREFIVNCLLRVRANLLYSSFVACSVNISCFDPNCEDWIFVGLPKVIIHKFTLFLLFDLTIFLYLPAWSILCGI